MIGRESASAVFDRGRNLFTLLWPLLSNILFHLCPCELIFSLVALKLLNSAISWWKHIRLAQVISDWHRTELRARMKRAGIKPRSVPLAPRLGALPSNLMVLSVVMLLMHRVGMSPPPTLAPNVTWVEVLGRVRDLHSSLPFTQPPPPEPPPSPCVSPSEELPVPAGDGEGDCEPACCACDCVNHLQCLSASDVEELMTCQFIVNPETTDLESPPPIESFESHVAISWWDCLHCCLSQWPSSFGPLGLLDNAAPEFTAIVDTGASMAVTPFASDFISLQPVSGRVLKGLTKGTAIAGVGIVCWKVEVAGKIVELRLKALHVPTCDVRLLSPQQLRQEHSSEITLMDIKKDCVQIVFPEGVLDCPLNESNLPVIRIATPADSVGDLKALNACVMAEMNQNLTPAQKELLKWHSKLGHIDLKHVQRIMKSGALGWSPLIKAAANCDLNKNPLICGSCAFAKAKRKSHRPKTEKVDNPPQPKDKQLSKEVLIPGQKVSMDHFIVSTPGRLFTSRGSEPLDRLFKGGVIFKDHATGRVFVEPVVNFTAEEALRAKRAYD